MGCSQLFRLGAVLLASSLAPSVAEAQSDSTPRRPEVRAAATAERSVRPDLAAFNLTFWADGATPLAAGQAVAVRADRLRRALQGLGIPRDSLVSGSRWYWWRGRIEAVVSEPRYIRIPRDSVTGAMQRAVRDTTYRANDAIEVRMRDLSKVGAAIDTATAHGVTQISGIRFQATDITAAQDLALREATERARRQATAIAEASGGRLGRALLLTTQQEGGYSDRYGFGVQVLDQAGAGGGEERGTEVIRPSVPVRVTVYGRWELLGRP